MARYRITKVYTRVGDGGDTQLGGGQSVPKDDLRIETYGTVDELNSQLGVVRAALAAVRAPASSADGEDAIDTPLARIQNDLFHLGSDLCLLDEDKQKYPVPQIEQRHVDELEQTIDRLQAALSPLEEFVLPGGTQAAAALHVARTVCRRAERLAVTLSRRESIGERVVSYLNRLSDLLFVMARYENWRSGHGDVLWRKDL